MGRNFKYRNEPESVKNELIVQFTPLCHKFARKYYSSYPTLYEYEDWFQIAQMGLLKAINEYIEEKGVKFITFATVVIKSYMLQEINIKSNREYVKRVTLTASLKPGQGFEKNRDVGDTQEGEDKVLSHVAYKKKSDNKYAGPLDAEEDEMLNNILIGDIIGYIGRSKIFTEMERTVFNLRIKPNLVGEPIL